MIEHGYLCSACGFLVKNALFQLRDRRSEMDVLDVVDNICSNVDLLDHLKHKVDTVKLKGACDAVLREWGDEVIEELMYREDNEFFTSFFCLSVTKMCDGIDMEEFMKVEKEKVEAYRQEIEERRQNGEDL